MPKLCQRLYFPEEVPRETMICFVEIMKNGGDLLEIKSKLSK